VRAKITLVFLTLTLLAACGRPGSATPNPAGATQTSGPTAAPTVSTPLVILVIPADMDKTESDMYQSLVYDLTQANGTRFQVRNTLSPDDVAAEGPAIKVVIVLPPDPGLAALTAAAPGVEFLAVGIPDLPQAANLSTIGANGAPVDQEAFLAGYIAGMLAPEWKVGILSQKDTPGGEAARTAFGNGFTFFCGACRNPNFSQPVGIYPVVVRVPTDAQQGEYAAYAKVLLDNFVKVAYLYPDVATPDVANYLAQYNVLMIGQSLPAKNLSANWIASLQPDTISAIKKVFPDLLAGKGGQVLPTPLYLTDVNADLLTAGKLQMVQQVLDGLQNGTIGTGVNP